MSGSFVAPWTVARQAPLSLGFSSQEYWNGLLFPSPGDLPDLKIEPASLALAGRFFTTETPGKAPFQDLRLSKGEGGKTTQKNCTKKIFMTRIITMV